MSGLKFPEDTQKTSTLNNKKILVADEYGSIQHAMIDDLATSRTIETITVKNGTIAVNNENSHDKTIIANISGNIVIEIVDVTLVNRINLILQPSTYSKITITTQKGNYLITEGFASFDLYPAEGANILIENNLDDVQMIDVRVFERLILKELIPVKVGDDHRYGAHHPATAYYNIGEVTGTKKVNHIQVNVAGEGNITVRLKDKDNNLITTFTTYLHPGVNKISCMNLVIYKVEIDYIVNVVYPLAAGLWTAIYRWNYGNRGSLAGNPCLGIYTIEDLEERPYDKQTISIEALEKQVGINTSSIEALEKKLNSL